MIPIVPAVIPTSSADLLDKATRLAFSAELHLDLVDGEFVEAKAWPFSPAGDLKSIKWSTEGFTLEVDLMVREPQLLVADLVEAGADMLVFHVETISPELLQDIARQFKISIGISLNNDTPIEALSPYIDIVDYIQLMGIAVIGRQGQSFDERVITRLKDCQSRFPKMLCSVDGSVNTATVLPLVEAGANRLVVGSAVVGAADPALAHFELSRLVNS
jgi:ribulose-phosphate 3-epimerase